ncbi:thioredoxin family protein [Paenarthrobacter sp. TA1.8]|uniref:thioredoxin family protein n=1 Tax=Paenarthrobacter sp. TA1.8 TaxID=3400219 RepID=UPI003B42DB7C
MEIEVFHIDNCPNTVTAVNHVEAALAALGREDIPVQLRRIETPADTLGTCFSGSPTIAADGTDIFPDGTPTRDLACRIYHRSEGFSGTPDIDQVIEALRRHGL